jgi:hypothetical protein
MKNKILSFILSFLMIFTASINYFTTEAEAATGIKEFTSSASNKASLVFTVCGVQLTSTEAVFTVSGLSSNANVTKIEVLPGTATTASPGALFVPQIIRLRSSNRSNFVAAPLWSIAFNPSSTPWTCNDFNGTQANGTYYVSFAGTGTAYPSLNGNITSGTWSYPNLKLKVYYEY